MNVLLLGNGFDLNFKLPTKYINFLNVTEYLVNNSTQNFDTIDSVFSNVELLTNDKIINESYSAYQEIYKLINIDNTNLYELVNTAKDNLWFNYLLKSFNKDIGWIDFEKEINNVIDIFESSLPSNGDVIFVNDDLSKEYILKSFSFIDERNSKNYYITGGIKIKKEYCIEYPLGSKNIIVDRHKIAETLFLELLELAKCLKLYLKIFIESLIQLEEFKNSVELIDLFNHMDHIITLNYTNTFEYLYNKIAMHIHGNVNKQIVLGINSNSHDSIETTDTSFLSFKKYYQRVMINSDIEYLEWLSEIKNYNKEYRLVIMGHSLDTTDKDIIKELLLSANNIVIISYDQISKSAHISNLINIYGKNEFDILRKNKKLKFIAIGDELNKLKKEIIDENALLLEPIIEELVQVI